MILKRKWFWCKRLEHVNWRLISKFNKLKLVKGLLDLNYHSNTLCETCQKMKQTIFHRLHNLVSFLTTFMGTLSCLLVFLVLVFFIIF
ncbi:transmembrane protein, putative [Medicago truncatula]|uniref:Transmembrane protein, putative n=1 Tax=Medicago truncatula TaxID=3880 RepID=G7JTH1_MEDTR|nr:transmembrane protein, putative [Medicago truncatula]